MQSSLLTNIIYVGNKNRGVISNLGNCKGANWMSYVKGLVLDIKWDAELRNNKTSVPSAVNCEQLKSSRLLFDAAKQGMQSLMQACSLSPFVQSQPLRSWKSNSSNERIGRVLHLYEKRSKIINHYWKVYMMNVKKSWLIECNKVMIRPVY